MKHVALSDSLGRATRHGRAVAYVLLWAGADGVTAGRGQEYRNDSRRYSGWQGARVIESSGRLDTGWIRTGYKLDTGAGQGAGAGGDGEPVDP